MDLTEAMEQLSRDERFKATVAAMNALLIQKGIYTPEELEAYLIESANARIRKQSRSG